MGTGIGAGGMAGGNLIHGLVHPEVGHLLIPRIAGDDFPGTCPYHGSCWEGLCSGPAIEARTGVEASELPFDHPVWDMVAQYTASALANIILVLSPKRIIIGGSVRKAGQLGEQEFFSKIRASTRAALANYVDSPALGSSSIDEYIVPPQLGDNAGVLGAIALAQDALAQDAPRFA